MTALGILVKMIVMMVLGRQARSLVLAVASLSIILAACGDDDDAAGGDALAVVAGFYPLAYVAEQVGGHATSVRNLTKPGVEPHDLELTPRQVGDIVDADVVITLSGFQPAVDDAIAQNAGGHVLDVRDVVPLELAATEHEPADGEGADDAPAGGDEHAADDHAEGEETTDPHMWLDPTKLATLGTAVGDAFADADPANAAAYRTRAANLVSRLGALDAEYADALTTCERREFVTSHAAFGHLAARYDLDQIAISGLAPGVEPSPERIREIQPEVEEHGITTIFFETLVSPDLAESIARDTGASTALLDPIEGIADTSQSDYFSVMRANLNALRMALSCT